MTQQVLHCKWSFPNTKTLGDQSSFGITVEATGSDTNVDSTALENWAVDLVNSTPTGASQALAAWLSNNLSRASNAVLFQATDVTAHLDGSPAGGPLYTLNFTLGAAEFAQANPDHDAICIGLRAPYSTDLEHAPAATLPTDDAAQDQGAPATHSGKPRPRARDRGRIYLGPFIPQAMAAGDGTISSTLTTDLNAWAQQTFSDQVPGMHNQFSPVIWSRRNASVKTIEFVYIDEGWCTQRRRGDTAAARVHSWTALTDSHTWV